MKFLTPVILSSLVTISSYSFVKAQKRTDTSWNVKNKTFKSCFNKVDTSKCVFEFPWKHNKSCIQGTFKIINDKYVIKIHPFVVDMKLNSGYDIMADSINLSNFVEILVYDNSNASLSKFCSCVYSSRDPNPTRILKGSFGHLVIGFSSLINSTHYPDISILIENLVFYDAVEGREISISNELIWKVHYEGIPG